MLDLLFKRRSIRKFKNVPLERELEEKLIKAALLAPSSRSIRPWEFIIVTNPETLNSLSKSKAHGSEFLKSAPMGFVIIANEVKSDVWIEDASIAAIIIQLEAEKLDLGSCWVQIRNRETMEGISSETYVKDLLGIPSHYRVECIIGLGYPDELRKPYKEADLQTHKVHFEKYKA